MSSLRTVAAQPPLSSPSRLEAVEPQRDALIAQTPVEQRLRELGKAVGKTVLSIEGLPGQPDLRAYGRVAKLVSDLVLGIKDSGAVPSQRDRWADQLGTAIQARIDALRMQPNSPVLQNCIILLERVLLVISTLQDENPPEPPAMPLPPAPPALPTETIV
ncbi:MAG: hypothetical protein NTW15_10165 [Burkholderiales bacterium]|nr:hypothetical protein [Burkholderiales bacterium]